MTRSRATADTQDNNGGSVAPFVAGKNAIINGDFRVAQRGTSVTLSNGVNAFGPDRWQVYMNFSSGSPTFSQQTFTPGTAPVAGYEGASFARITNVASSSYVDFKTRLEDVRLFAGQTVTLSFWAKATSSITGLPLIRQNFGSGGSASVDTYASSNLVISSNTWTRYSFTISVPSITGKTIGTSSYLEVYPFIYTAGTIASNTMEFWGVQLEAGSVATPFTTATGTIQGELAACQRYYQKSYPQGTAPATALVADGIQVGKVASNTIAITERYNSINLPVVMRTAPTVTIRPYSTPANTGRVSSANSGVDLGANSGTAQFIADKGFSVYNNSGGTLTTTDLAVIYHFEASAEL